MVLIYIDNKMPSIRFPGLHSAVGWTCSEDGDREGKGFWDKGENPYTLWTDRQNNRQIRLKKLHSRNFAGVRKQLQKNYMNR